MLLLNMTDLLPTMTTRKMTMTTKMMMMMNPASVVGVLLFINVYYLFEHVVVVVIGVSRWPTAVLVVNFVVWYLIHLYSYKTILKGAHLHDENDFFFVFYQFFVLRVWILVMPTFSPTHIQFLFTNSWKLQDKYLSSESKERNFNIHVFA